MGNGTDVKQSRTLRWAYLDQLKSTNLLDMGLMPMLFAMLGVSEVGAWNFPANQYAVDEFYPDRGFSLACFTMRTCADTNSPAA